MTSTNGPNRRRAALTLALKLAVSFGLLAAVITINRRAFADALAHRPAVLPLITALACYLFGVMLAFLRWHVLVRALDLPFTRGEAFRLGWIGMLFNMLVPGAVGGDIAKAGYLAGRQHHKGKAVASVVIDRLVGLIGLFLLAAIGGAIAWGGFDRRARPIVMAAWIALGVTLAITLASFFIHPHGPLTRWLGKRPKAARLLGELHATGIAYRRRSHWVLLAIAMAAVTHLANVVAFACVGSAFAPGSAPSILGYLTVVPLVLFSTAIPLPFSGLGASEGISDVLFRSLNYNAGAVAMIGFRLLQLCAALIGAWVYVAYRARPAAEAACPRPHTPVALRDEKEGAISP